MSGLNYKPFLRIPCGTSGGHPSGYSEYLEEEIFFETSGRILGGTPQEVSTVTKTVTPRYIPGGTTYFSMKALEKFLIDLLEKFPVDLRVEFTVDLLKKKNHGEPPTRIPRYKRRILWISTKEFPQNFPV